MPSITVPFVDLRAQHEEVRSEIEAAIADVINRSSFIGGSYVNTFERQFADYLGVKEVVGLANGTDAVWMALLGAGVRPGEAVITVPNTFIATVEAITRCGAHPLFVDCSMDTASMDVLALKALLEKECAQEGNGRVVHRQTKRRLAAILPVHLYGLPVDMQSILAIAREYHLPVVEDAAQAHGAKIRIDGEWKCAGSLGLAAGFSFYPAKNLGAMGDGGALATNDPQLAARARLLRDHASVEKYIHLSPDGWNSRLDALQAAVLSIKLRKLDEWNARRRLVAAAYREALTDLPLDLPVEPEYAEPIYHVYVVRSVQRDHLLKELNARGIGSGLHYPIPLHRQKAYESLGYQLGAFPNAEQSAATVLSLPMHPSLTHSQIQQVADALKGILSA